MYRTNFKAVLVAFAAVAAAIAIAPKPAYALDAQDMEVIREFQLISPEQAKDAAKSAKAGVVKDIDLDDRSLGRGWKYEIEIVTESGREYDVDIDAKTGEVLKVKRDW